MEYLKNGAEDIVLLFKDRSTMDKSLAGVGVFCARVVDRIWQGEHQLECKMLTLYIYIGNGALIFAVNMYVGCYLDSAGNMFDFLFHLLGQAKDKSRYQH